MTNERKIKVLEAMIEEVMDREKMRLVSGSEFRRNIGNFSKKTGISENEIREIIEPIIRRQVDKMLAR